MRSVICSRVQSGLPAAQAPDSGRMTFLTPPSENIFSWHLHHHQILCMVLLKKIIKICQQLFDFPANRKSGKIVNTNLDRGNNEVIKVTTHLCDGVLDGVILCNPLIMSSLPSHLILLNLTIQLYVHTSNTITLYMVGQKAQNSSTHQQLNHLRVGHHLTVGQSVLVQLSFHDVTGIHSFILFCPLKPVQCMS